MKDCIGRLLYRLRTINPVRLVAMGYLSYILMGFALLSLPFMQTNPVSILDNLFISTSAVSTTGLVTVTVNKDYTFWGQLVILLLIQLGGIGYMTFSSFVILSTKKHLTDHAKNIARTVFSIPQNFRIEHFVVSVMLFSVVIEFFGAVGLFFVFRDANVADPLWNAVFHSVSAFCTAGFSLFPISFEGPLAKNLSLNIIISVLSILGAMGFIVCLDVWRLFRRKSHHRLTLTTKVIIAMTSCVLIIGTLLLFLTEFYGGETTSANRLLFSFFQAMSALTTVGFNSVAMGTLSKSAILLLCILMIIGASPAGTGGGLKTTTFSAIWGLMKSVVTGNKDVKIWGATVPEDRVKTAVASLSLYLSALTLGTYLLTLVEKSTFVELFFEAASALGTVGLSLGITGSLTELGKLIIILLMYIGRVGPLTFGMSLYVRSEIIFDDKKSDLAV